MLNFPHILEFDNFHSLVLPCFDFPCCDPFAHLFEDEGYLIQVIYDSEALDLQTVQDHVYPVCKVDRLIVITGDRAAGEDRAELFHYGQSSVQNVSAHLILEDIGPVGQRSLKFSE